MRNTFPLKREGETPIAGKVCSDPIQSSTPSVGSPSRGSADTDDSGSTVVAIAHELDSAHRRTGFCPISSRWLCLGQPWLSRVTENQGLIPEREPEKRLNTAVSVREDRQVTSVATRSNCGELLAERHMPDSTAATRERVPW